jgi:ribonucleoside-diphosphate reductase alpha chain
MANIGAINGSNLCTEIVQPTSEEEIPTCNLASVNMPKFVIRPVKGWETVTSEELVECYDFEMLGKIVRSMVENINHVIDCNFYPLDETINGVLVQGPISKTNFRNRPMGLGVSGMYNALMRLQIPFDSDAAKLFNKMFFACMYYNALLESHSLACKDGEYSTFRTGEWKRYNPITQDYTIVPGSPLANGFFQFDLWKLEEEYHRNRKTLVEFDEFGEPVYQPENLVVLNPEVWGQQGDWEQLRQDILRDGVRNSMLLAPMPTASTANIMSNVGAFEAPVGLICTKKIKDVISGYAVPEFIEAIRNPKVVWNQDVIDFVIASQGSIKHLDIFYKKFYPKSDIDYDYVHKLQRLFKTAYEISQKDTIRMTQERGIYVCQSQSFNVFLAQPSEEQMYGVLQFGANLRLKTMIYYLRQANANPAFPLGVKSEIISLVEELRDIDAVSDDEEEIEEIKPVIRRSRPECISCSV